MDQASSRAASAGPTPRRPTQLIRIVAAACVAVGVVLGAVLIGQHFRGRPTGTPAQAQASAPVGSAGPVRCPDRFDLGTGPPSARRSGQLVPAGAEGGLVCTYDARVSATSPVLTDSRPLAHAAGPLAGYLNALPEQPPADPESSPGQLGTQVHACMLASLESYQIVLSYPDHTHVIVGVYDGCGMVEQAGAIRYLRSMTDLRNRW